MKTLSINKRIKSLIFLIVISFAITPFSVPVPSNALTGSEFQAGRIIDDVKFYSNDTMSVAQIQAFLNAKVPTCDTNGIKPAYGTTRAAYGASVGHPAPYVCLKDYSQSIPGVVNGGSDLCKQSISAGVKSAAQIIYDVSIACGINQQVMLVLLQKEQSLVTDEWPWTTQYRSATGYGCPDTAPCDAEFYGFFNQVYQAAKAFRRYEANPNGFNYKSRRNNTIYFHPGPCQTRDGSGNCTNYFGRFGSSPDIQYCGNTNIFIENQATANLYIYTPYQPNQAALNNLYGTGDNCSAYGNRNFWRIFTDWFGSTLGAPDYSCKDSSNVVGSLSGARAVSTKNVSGVAQQKIAITFLNNTGSKCIETHVWQPGQQSWVTNIATNHPSVNPLFGDVVTGDFYGDDKDDFMFIKYGQTGSGRIEAHGWDSTNQRWVTNIATNHGEIDHANADVIAADTNGDGKDELILVKYAQTGSGKVETHTWAPGQQSWITNIATNHPEVDPLASDVIAADTNGDGRDELVLVKYSATGSGRIETHIWAPGQQSWVTNIATNHPQI